MARRFPLYIDLTGRRVLVYGGGAVASRRVETLSRFGPAVTVVAPEIAPAIRSLPGWRGWRTSSGRRPCRRRTWCWRPPATPR